MRMRPTASTATFFTVDSDRVRGVVMLDSNLTVLYYWVWFGVGDVCILVVQWYSCFIIFIADEN